MLQEDGSFSENTITDRRRILFRLHEDLPYGVLAACADQLRAWLAGPDDRRWSRNTRATYADHIWAFFAWAARNGYLPAGNPTAGLRRPKRPRPVARRVAAQVIDVALAAPEPLLTAVLLGRYQGMRRCESAACRREDITEEETYIRHAKGGDPQVVPTHPVVWQHVKDRPPGPLVVDRHGRQMTPDQLGQVALRYFRRNGLDGTGLHDLRRWCGREIYKLTRDIRVTQEILRHVSVATTQVYIAVSAEEKARAVRALPPSAVEPGSSRLDGTQESVTAT